MIGHFDFDARLAVCKTCEFWQGACLKSNVLRGDLGCPVRKFDGVNGAGYMDDVPVQMPQMPESTGCTGCGADGDLQPMSWQEVVRHLMEAGKVWRAAGYPLTPDKAYIERINTCKTCVKGQYKWFQCRHCKCLVYTKAKVATEDCPYGLWPKLS